MKERYHPSTKNEREGDKIANQFFRLNRNRISLPRLDDYISRNKVLDEIAKTKSSKRNSIFITDSNKEQHLISLRAQHRASQKLLLNEEPCKLTLSPEPKSFRKGWGEKDSYNVFNFEENELKELFEKFGIKPHKEKVYGLEKKRLVFNRLYGISPEMSARINKVKSHKNIDLKEYQNNVLEAAGKNITDEKKLRDLIHDLKELREDTESIRPLPKINLGIIYRHVIKGGKERNIRNISVKDLRRSVEDPKDDFEREQILIKKTKIYKTQPRSKKYRKLVNVPEHLRSILSDNMKLFN